MPSPALERLLAAAFDDYCGDEDPTGYEERRQDFVFHMTDWMNDLDDLQALFDHPENATPKSACLFLIGFLNHVIPHLNAAGRLFEGKIADPFAEPANSKSTTPK